jgi:hypothetical protein
MIMRLLPSSSACPTRWLAPICAAALLSCSAAASAVGTVEAGSDFHVVAASADTQKYLTYGWNGWNGKTIHWRYNDSNRSTAAAGTADAALNAIRAAMDKWSAVCAITFVYDGTSSNGASLATNNTRDSVNVIAWSALESGVAGQTWVSASSTSSALPTLDEADMLLSADLGAANLRAVLVHEVGHMLGLKHSNVESAVMSGPNTAPDPSTTYSGLTELAADDISGCRALYGEVPPQPSDTTVALSATALNFADTQVNNVSNTQTVAIINTGSSLLTVTGATLTGDDFTLISTTCATATLIGPGGRCGATIRFTPKSAGARTGSLVFKHNASSGSATVTLAGNGVTSTSGNTPSKRVMIEYRYAPLDYYFMTSRDSEKAALDATSGWSRTGESFPVYTSMPTGGQGITRFFFAQVARGNTRGSHFYAVLDSDVAALNNLNPSQSTAPGLPQNEGVDSYAFTPLVSGVGGSCASGLLPVYRLFRGNVRFPDDPNHRYTATVATYNAFVAQGWDGEGVSFCAPAN